MITAGEARILMERRNAADTVMGLDEDTHEHVKIKKYNSLINGLKIDSDG